MDEQFRLLIDVTTIQRRRGTPPIGIPRVEQLLATSAINRFPGATRFCVYDNQQSRYLDIPVKEVVEIIRSIDPDAPLSEDAVVASADAGARGQGPAFEGLEAFVAAGLLWDHDSLEVLYRLRKSHGFKAYAVNYDSIPLLMPEYSVKGVEQKFTKYVLDMAWVSDAIYCISQNSMDDLERFYREFQAPCPPLRRLRLGCDFSAPAPTTQPPAFRALQPGRFVLCVGTVEARKNHRLLFDVWRELYRADERSLLPLVVVGRKGWSVADLVDQMSRGPGLLSEYIHWFDGLFDIELAWLYENCRFAVYPSLYEGWGLPIVESLARGKLCLHSNTSSMPEASQGLGEGLDPLDTRQWISRIHYYATCDRAVQAKEATIRSGFRPAYWNDCLTSFFDELLRDRARPPGSPAASVSRQGARCG